MQLASFIHLIYPRGSDTLEPSFLILRNFRVKGKEIKQCIVWIIMGMPVRETTFALHLVFRPGDQSLCHSGMQLGCTYCVNARYINSTRGTCSRGCGLYVPCIYSHARRRFRRQLKSLLYVCVTSFKPFVCWKKYLRANYLSCVLILECNCPVEYSPDWYFCIQSSRTVIVLFWHGTTESGTEKEDSSCRYFFIVQELCESRGGRPGLSVLTSLLVSVDVKLYWTML